MNFAQIMIVKLTVKKILSIVDHMQIIATHGMGDHPAKLTLQDWFDEMRLHLRKIEYNVETAAQ